MAESPPRSPLPAAEAPAAAAAARLAPRRPLWRRALRVGVWSALALLLLVAGLVFVASRTVTLQWAAQQVVRFTGGRLQIEGITGSILTGIAADSLQWQDGAVSVAVTSPRFTYHPFAMLDGLFRIESIGAASVEVDLPPDPVSAEPRQSVRLPPALASMLPVAIERVDLGRLIVRRAGSQLAKVHNLEFVFRHDGDRLSARLLNLDVIAGDSRIGVRGDAAVLARAPYVTDGRLAVRLPMQLQPLLLDVRISGPLAELAVRASTVLAGAALEARTVVHTLGPRPLRDLRLDVKDLDLSLHDPAWPVTSLSGSYVAEVMPAWASERRPLLIGPINLTNSLAAPLDRKRLPVAKAKAVVGYVDGGLEVRGLQASGPIGEVTGEGWAGPDSLRFVLASERLNLHGIDSTLAPRTVVARIAVEPIGKAGAAVVAVRPAQTKAAGEIAAVGRAGGLSVSATAADASLAAELEAVIVGGRKLEISRAQVQFKDRRPGGAGRAGFLGSVGLAAPWPVDLSGHLRNVDPAQLVRMPHALLSGTWRVSGRMAADGGNSGDSGQGGGLLQAYLDLDESRFRGLSLAGRLAATLSVSGRQLRQLSAVHGAMRWGTGTVDVAGALGAAADVLRLTVNLPNLGEVQEGVTGAVSGYASLQGALDAPALEARFDGQQLGATTGEASARIAGAMLQLRAARLGNGPLRLQADLDGVELGSTISERPGRAAAGLLALGRMTAVVEGSPADHRIDADAVGAGQRLTLGAHGGIGADGFWRGVVNQLAASHPFLAMPAVRGPAATAARPVQPAEFNRPQADFRSLQPFAVLAGSGLVTLRNARFELHGARLNLKQADWQAPLLTLSADASGIAARWFDRFGKLDALPRDLTVAAAVDFTGNLDRADAAGWRGRIRLHRETGDISLTGPGGADPVPAGLRTLQASLSIDERKLDLVLNVEGEHIGRIAAEAGTMLPRASEPVWNAAALARSPLAGRLDLAVNSFRWILPLEDESWRVDGALSARLQLAGTLGNPRAQGPVTGNNLSAEEQTLGMRLSNGVLAAELVGERIDVKLLRFESGAGSVAVSGLLQPAGGGRSQARIVIDRLPIALGIGERVVVSGSTTTTLAGHALSVAGRLVAEDGLVDLKGGSAPDVALDMAVTNAGVPGVAAREGLADAARRTVVSRSAGVAGGGSPGEGAAHEGAVKARAFGIDTDVEMDLGRRFRVAGSGLDANLRGAIRLRGYYPQAPRATGTVELANGSYRFDGRELRVKRGRIVFDGPLDDPSLDIVAVRDNLKIEPAVELGGTAQAPVVRLASTPDVLDAEKLAWLVLGASPATRSAGQRATLQRAAATLFGDEAAVLVAGFNGKPGGAGAQGSPGAIAMLGQRLASRLSAIYGQSLRGVWNILKLQYEITDRLSLSAQAGSDSAAELFRSNSSD